MTAKRSCSPTWRVLSSSDGAAHSPLPSGDCNVIAVTTIGSGTVTHRHRPSVTKRTISVSPVSKRTTSVNLLESTPTGMTCAEATPLIAPSLSKIFASGVGDYARQNGLLRFLFVIRPTRADVVEVTGRSSGPAPSDLDSGVAMSVRTSAM